MVDVLQTDSLIAKRVAIQVGRKSKLIPLQEQDFYDRSVSHDILKIAI